MKTLVTGAGGFIGSHLVQQLEKEGKDVKAMVHYNSAGTNGWLDHIETQAEIIRGDIRDQSFVRNVVGGCDRVFHLAALISIPYSYMAIKSYLETNINGTYNILEACRDKRVMVTSTSEVYGTAQYTPMDESHPKNPQSPYAASKVAADALAMSYHKSFGTPVTVVRPFNTYGPRQSMRAVIPQIICQSIDSNTALIGNAYSQRDFVYVEDTVDAMVKIMNCKALIGEEVNIATGIEYPIGSIADYFEVKIKKEKKRLRPKESEVDRLCGDNRKLLNNIIFNPAELRQGLYKTKRWFKENRHLHKEGYAV